jgi:hypothetical protein
MRRVLWPQFVSKYISTIGVDFGVKQVNVRGIDVKVWRPISQRVPPLGLGVRIPDSGTERLQVNFWDLAGRRVARPGCNGGSSF